MKEYRKSMKAFDTDLKILVGHIVRAKEAGKTEADVMNDPVTHRCLKNLVKSEYAFENNRERLKKCLDGEE